MSFFSDIKKYFTILLPAERRHFKLLLGISLLSSLMDVAGIGGVACFLWMVMNPTIATQLPIIRVLFSAQTSYITVLTVLGSGTVMFFLCKTIVSCLTQRSIVHYAFSVGARLRTQLMQHYLFMPYERFLYTKTADIINDISMGVDLYVSQGLLPLLTFLTHAIFISTVLIFLCILYPLVTLMLAMVFGSVLLANAVYLKKIMHKLGVRNHRANEKIIQNIREAFFMLKEVKVLEKEQFFLQRMQEAAMERALVVGATSAFQRLPLYLIESVLFVFVIGLCLVELHSGMSSTALIALCGALVTAASRLLPSVYQIAVATVSLHSARHNLALVYNSLKLNTALSPLESDDGARPMFTSGSVIRFENVSYGYPNAAKNALSAVSLSICFGESIGIIGASGAGKSTLVDILLGLLLPTKGRITLNGQVRATPGWLSDFAYIPQSIALLEGSIQDNIAFGESEKNIDVLKLQQSIAMAQLDVLITELPLGVNTLVGDNGIRLSGGQRQRIALARAFYHDRNIIIMDEATSALDNETEREVIHAIKQLRGIKTLIIIAHRHSTIEHCDKIYKLAAGHLVGSGSFESMVINQ